MNKKRNSDAPVKGKLLRSAAVTGTAIKVGVKTASHLIKRPFMSPSRREASTNKLHADNAETVFNSLSKLRGAPLKIAQLLSAQSFILPPEYIESLGQTLHQMPPLNRALIRRQFISELGAGPENLFATFDPLPFAAARLGQVHRARLHTGEEVAVKVQYPGMESAISSDMATIRALSRGLPGGAIWSVYIDEVEARLTEEVDYTIETESMEWFSKALKLDGIQIPGAVKPLTSKRILTMTYMDGMTLGDYLSTDPDQDERNNIAQRLWDLYMIQLYDLLKIQADPHAGNFLIKGDKIGLLDFGCVKTTPKAFAQAHLSMMRSIRDGDFHGTNRAFERIMEPATQKESEEVTEQRRQLINKFTAHFHQSYSSTVFDFSSETYFLEAKRLAQDSLMYSHLFRGERHFVFVDRTLMGLNFLFHKMKAKVSLRLPAKVCAGAE